MNLTLTNRHDALTVGTMLFDMEKISNIVRKYLCPHFPSVMSVANYYYNLVYIHFVLINRTSYYHII